MTQQITGFARDDTAVDNSKCYREGLKNSKEGSYRGYLSAIFTAVECSTFLLCELEFPFTKGC